MTLIEDGHEVAPGVRMHAAPGHNRDMMMITAESRDETFCFLSDLVPTAAHLQPTWIPAFDLFPLESIATRTAWLERAAEGSWVVGFAHDVSVDFARVVSHHKTRFALAP